MTVFNDGNFENNLDVTIAGTGIEGDHSNSGCVYSDIDDQRQNATLRVLSAIANIKPTISTTDPATSTAISYHSISQLVPLNN